jgi:hypothetical protein
LPHLTLLSATLQLEEMVAIFDTQPITPNFPTSLKELYKMYPAHPTVQGRLQLRRYLNLGEYTIYTICKLAEGDFLTHYPRNSGGDYRDHWPNEYPTDSELIFHLFSTYMILTAVTTELHGLLTALSARNFAWDGLEDFMTWRLFFY